MDDSAVLRDVDEDNAETSLTEEVLELLADERPEESMAEADSAVEQNVTHLEDAEMSENSEVSYVPPSFKSNPEVVYEERFQTFTKGVKWGKDGAHFLVSTDDCTIWVRRTNDFSDRNNIPDSPMVDMVCKIVEPAPIHDFAWHPSHEFGGFVTTCNTQPCHLYDCKTGQLLASYMALNHVEEQVSAYSVQFDRTGEKLFAGYRKFVRVFDVECPRLWSEISTWKLFQAGIVSCLDSNGGNLLAVGTYCNSVALYDIRDRTISHDPVISHSGGLTQVKLSHDGNLLYSGARMDNTIICRDIRNFEQVLYEFPRKCATNQRVQFDLPYEENYLCTGNTNGTCFMWNLRDLNIFQENKCRPSLILNPHCDTNLGRFSAANGVSFHPWMPVIATSSGGRSKVLWDDDKEECFEESPYENCVKLWKFVD